jgi:translation initiation factor 3 subunit D
LYHISPDYEKDKVSAYDPKPLNRYDTEEQTVKFFGNSSTCEDPKIREEFRDKADVFITDKLLSVMMTMIFTSRPWHLKITKIGNKIFFDKMYNSQLDLTTVNESADVPPPDVQDENINNFYNLSCEATLINEFLKEQVVSSDEPNENVTEPNPFATDDNQDDFEKVAYTYRLWNIGDIAVLVRCQIHSYFVDESEAEQYVNIYALNEYNGNNYKSTNNTPSSLFKKEIGNNHLKVTKWGVQSYLAGVNWIKFAFVTRKKLNDNKHHLVTGFYETKLQELLNFTNFNSRMAWGIFKQIIEIIKAQPDGSFILMKDLSTNKPLVKLF